MEGKTCCRKEFRSETKKSQFNAMLKGFITENYNFRLIFLHLNVSKNVFFYKVMNSVKGEPLVAFKESVFSLL